MGAITGEVGVFVVAPIGFLEALGVAPNPSKHARPWVLEHKEATAIAFDAFTFFVEDVGVNAGERLRGGSGFGIDGARDRRNHDSACFGLPPGIDDRASLSADHLVVPHPRFWIDRLSDAA